MIGWPGQWTQTPSATPLQPQKGNAHFWITFNFWWSAGWSMDSNPIHHPSPAKKMKCSFLDYVQLLMIGWAGRWTQTPYATPLQPQKLNAHFWIMFNFWWLAGLVDGLKPHLPPFSRQKKWNTCFSIMFNFWWLARLVNGLKPHLPPLSRQKKWNAHFWIMFNFWWLAGLVDGLKPHLPPLSSQKHEILIFGLCLTYDGLPGWSMDSNPICQTSSAKIMKCSFLDYVQLLMISQAVQWTQTPSATPLQPQKWNAHFWITFNFWWLAMLVHGLKPHLPPLSGQEKWNAHFWIMFNFWW